MGPTTGIGAVGPGGGIPGWGGTPGGGRRGTALSVVGDAGGGAAQDPICLCQDLEAAVAGGVCGVTVGVDLLGMGGGERGSRGTPKGDPKRRTQEE